MHLIKFPYTTVVVCLTEGSASASGRQPGPGIAGQLEKQT